MSNAPHWQGHLTLRYRRDTDGRCVASDAHEGPLRVLKALYPEGPTICHHVLVHPPGGIVGGDDLTIDLQVGAGAHALVTTPGATRFYRSAGAPAAQHARLRLGTDARLEWLPLEAIAHSGCIARNSVAFELAPGAAMIGWDLLALGLPASNEPFERGRFEQRIEWPGHWLERGLIDAADQRLLASPLGLDGQRVLACAWFAAGTALAATQREALLAAARGAADSASPRPIAGSTSPNAQLVVLRVLGARVEPVIALLAAVRAAWREIAWGLAAEPPRVWRT